MKEVELIAELTGEDSQNVPPAIPPPLGVPKK